MVNNFDKYGISPLLKHFYVKNPSAFEKLEEIQNGGKNNNESAQYKKNEHKNKGYGVKGELYPEIPFKSLYSEIADLEKRIDKLD